MGSIIYKFPNALAHLNDLILVNWNPKNSGLGLISMKIEIRKFLAWTNFVENWNTVGLGYYGTENYGTVVPWLAENDVIAHFKA